MPFARIFGCPLDNRIVVERDAAPWAETNEVKLLLQVETPVDVDNAAHFAMVPKLIPKSN